MSKVRPEPGSYDLDDRAALGVLEHVGDRRLLDVEDLAADRQQRLELGVAGELGGAERRVALDDEQLAAVDVVAAAVGELGGQRGASPARSSGAAPPCAAGPRSGSGPRATIFSRTARACALASRWVEVRKSFSSLATTSATIRLAAEVPSTSLVWPSNCGSASRTVTTAVRPSMASSLTTSSSATRSSLAARSTSLTVLATDRSKPVMWVPPLGVAMMLTKRLQPWCRSRCPSAARCPRRVRG